MNEKKAKQVSFDENPDSFIGARLSPENRWVKLAQIIPWLRLEGRYHRTFANPKVGNPAKLLFAKLFDGSVFNLNDAEYLIFQGCLQNT